MNVLSIPFQPALWPSALDLQFAPQWFYHNFMSILEFCMFLWICNICNHQAIHSVSLWSDAFDLIVAHQSDFAQCRCDIDVCKILVTDFEFCFGHFCFFVGQERLSDLGCIKCENKTDTQNNIIKIIGVKLLGTQKPSGFDDICRYTYPLTRLK